MALEEVLCLSHIYTGKFHSLADRYNKNSFVAFLDLKKSYDSIAREILWSKLINSICQ